MVQELEFKPRSDQTKVHVLVHCTTGIQLITIQRVKGDFSLPASSPWLSGTGMRILSQSLETRPSCGKESPPMVFTGHGFGHHIGVVLFGATEHFSLLEEQEKTLSPLNPTLPCFFSAHIISLNFKRVVASCFAIQSSDISNCSVACLSSPSVPAHGASCVSTARVAQDTNTFATEPWHGHHYTSNACTEASSGPLTLSCSAVSASQAPRRIPEPGGLTSKMTLSFSFSLPKSSTKTLTSSSHLGP